MPKSLRGQPYLAFDFGAESGRAVLAHLRSGSLTTEEIHRFPNEPVEYGGALHWDAPRLWFEMRKALAGLGEVELAGIGVDAWGVDYALLGERGELLQNPYHYRDRRTEGIMEEVLASVGKEEVYRATGVQFMPINTLYQLLATRRQTPKMLDAARYLLTIPDLFNYWLSGNAVCEFTNATTTQMVDPVKRTWATTLMESLELPAHLPAPIVEPDFDSGIRGKVPARDEEHILEAVTDAPAEEMAVAGTVAGDTVVRAPMLANYLFSALAGTTWYMQFFFYTMGETQMGRYKFSSWTLHMASIIIFSTLWGIALKEWRGAGSRTKLLVGFSLLVLVSSTVIVGYGNYVGGSSH